VFEYDAIVHMGLEDFAKGLKIEVAAANFKANDSGGASVGPLMPFGPYLLPTTSDLGMLTALNLSVANDANDEDGYSAV